MNHTPSHAPKRYSNVSYGSYCEFEERDNGDYVAFEDYEKIKNHLSEVQRELEEAKAARNRIQNETIREYLSKLELVNGKLADMTADRDVILGMYNTQSDQLPELLSERDKYKSALSEIKSYGDYHSGCCPYGCDCPTIAEKALTTAKE